MDKTEITIELSKPALWYIDELLRTGLYGKTHDEVVLTLINSGIRSLIATNQVKHYKPPFVRTYEGVPALPGT